MSCASSKSRPARPRSAGQRQRSRHYAGRPAPRSCTSSATRGSPAAAAISCSPTVKSPPPTLSPGTSGPTLWCSRAVPPPRATGARCGLGGGGLPGSRKPPRRGDPGERRRQSRQRVHGGAVPTRRSHGPGGWYGGGIARTGRALPAVQVVTVCGRGHVTLCRGRRLAERPMEEHHEMDPGRTHDDAASRRLWWQRSPSRRSARPAVVKQAPPHDPLVSISCPATVVISQGDHVAGLITCPQQGTTTLPVPLRALDGRSGDSFYVAVRPGLLSLPLQNLLDAYCASCGPDYPCCPPSIRPHQ